MPAEAKPAEDKPAEDKPAAAAEPKAERGGMCVCVHTCV